MNKQLRALRHSWNAFQNKDPTDLGWGATSSREPHRSRLHVLNEQTILAPIYNRIALDVVANPIIHARVDQNGSFLEEIKSSLNECLTVGANDDQTWRAFFQDLILSMFDEGVVAAVPIETNVNIFNSNSFDVLSMRTGKITQWYPKHVRVQVYNPETGTRQELVVPKASTAIIENPFYTVMNEENSIVKRLKKKLVMSDILDEKNSSGKLDLIIQLPYAVKTSLREEQAEKRRSALQKQLTNSEYGIGYIDSTERITQLNRAIENTLLAQIQYYTELLYSQLGVTAEIMAGTADDKAMTNYNQRVIRVVSNAIIDEFKRKFLTKTARTQGQTIMTMTDPFMLVTTNDLASMSDTFRRNQILTSNEIRSKLGYKPSDDPNANVLANPNINTAQSGDEASPSEEDYGTSETPMGGDIASDEGANSVRSLFE